MEDQLRFVKYTVNASSLPVNLAVPEEIEDLAYVDIPKTYGFEKEQKMIEKYEADQKTKALGLQRSPPTTAVASATTTSSSTSEVRGTDGGSGSGPTAVVASAASAVAVGSTHGPNPWYEEQIQSMMKETGQNKQICEFYLESQDWDLEKACISFRNA